MSGFYWELSQTGVPADDLYVLSFLHGRFPETVGGSARTQGAPGLSVAQPRSGLGKAAPHPLAQRNQLGDVQHLESVIFN